MLFFAAISETQELSVQNLVLIGIVSSFTRTFAILVPSEAASVFFSCRSYGYKQARGISELPLLLLLAES